ncbi:hypothetical protein BN1200_440001 [Klebsiella variicola]|nr:hypothetical protein NIHE120848_56840 [Klebsiella pneumoniae]CTQ14787.1 hypothetical protein BN1200_440001 [Klebsiella variicola]
MTGTLGTQPSAATLVSVPLITYDEELPLLRMVWTAMFQRAPDMQATFTIQDLRIIRDLVRDGHRWSVLPDYHCLDDLKSVSHEGRDCPGKSPLSCLEQEYFE